MARRGAAAQRRSGFRGPGIGTCPSQRENDETMGKTRVYWDFYGFFMEFMWFNGGFLVVSWDFLNGILIWDLDGIYL